MPNDIKDAVIIKVTEIKADTPRAYLLDCEGDEDWFPKKLVNLNKQDMTLEVGAWLLKEKGWIL